MNTEKIVKFASCLISSPIFSRSLMHTTPVAVAVAIVVRNGHIFIGCRPDNARYAGAWEFPGGACLEGEAPADTALRELAEETEMHGAICREMFSSTNTFPDGRQYHVRYFVVEDARGEPSHVYYPRIAWVRPAELASYAMLEGNRAVIDRIAGGLLDALLNPPVG